MTLQKRGADNHQQLPERLDEADEDAENQENSKNEEKEDNGKSTESAGDKDTQDDEESCSLSKIDEENVGGSSLKQLQNTSG